MRQVSLNTWYIAGNHITAEGLKPLCDVLRGLDFTSQACVNTTVTGLEPDARRKLERQARVRSKCTAYWVVCCLDWSGGVTEHTCQKHEYIDADSNEAHVYLSARRGPILVLRDECCKQLASKNQLLTSPVPNRDPALPNISSLNYPS